MATATDPRAAKLLALKGRCGACAGALANGVCRRCHPEQAVKVPKEKTEKTRRSRPVPEEVVLPPDQDGQRLAESISGLDLATPRFHQEQSPEQRDCSVCGKPFTPPSHATGRPVTRCEDCRKHHRKPGHRLPSVAALDLSTAGPDRAQDHCDCGRPSRHRGRCWGHKENPPPPTRIDQVLATTEAEVEQATREAAVAMGHRPLSPETCRVVRLGDPELAAISAVLATLRPLDQAAQRRALDYCRVRLSGPEN